MSKQVKLDGRAESAYGKVTAFMRKSQVYTKTDLVNYLKRLGKKESAAVATAVVMLSPRLEAKRKGADCRGNMSNPWGHLAYNEKLAKVKGQEQKFRFRMRKAALEPLTRGTKVAAAQKAPAAPAKVAEKV